MDEPLEKKLKKISSNPPRAWYMLHVRREQSPEQIDQTLPPVWRQIWHHIFFPTLWYHSSERCSHGPNVPTSIVRKRMNGAMLLWSLSACRHINERRFLPVMGVVNSSPPPERNGEEAIFITRTDDDDIRLPQCEVNRYWWQCVLEGVLADTASACLHSYVGRTSGLDGWSTALGDNMWHQTKVFWKARSYCAVSEITSFQDTFERYQFVSGAPHVSFDRCYMEMIFP